MTQSRTQAQAIANTRRSGAASTRFLENARGVAAIEFGLLAPFMLVIYVGLVTFSQGWAINTRLAGIASVTGDLVAQTTSDQSDGDGGGSSGHITTADLDNIMSIVASFIEPYDATQVRVTITSMKLDDDEPNDDPKVDWSYSYNGAPKHEKGTNPFSTADITPMLSPETSLIVAEVHYTFSTAWYNTVVHGLFGANTIALKETMFFLPRQADHIELEDDEGDEGDEDD